MEFVYVVKRFDLFDMRSPHGLELLDDAAMGAYLSRIRERGFFVERRWAERDASLKQIIPYCLVVRDGAVFTMRRLSAGGEARLHGKRSIGVGGHVNPVDRAVRDPAVRDPAVRDPAVRDPAVRDPAVRDPAVRDSAVRDSALRDVLGQGLRREIDEELFVDGAWRARAVGVLNDESTDVGSVHFGLVHTVAVTGDVRVRETDALEGGFLPAADLARLCANERESFETWSALLVDRLDELLPASPVAA